MIDNDNLDNDTEKSVAGNKLYGELHSDGSDYALHEELGSFRNEPVSQRVGRAIEFNPDAFPSMRRSGSYIVDNNADGKNVGSTNGDNFDFDGVDKYGMDNENRALWFDRETSRRADGDPATHELVQRVDQLPLWPRNAMIKEVYAASESGATDFDAAVRVCAAAIDYEYATRNEDFELKDSSDGWVRHTVATKND